MAAHEEVSEQADRRQTNEKLARERATSDSSAAKYAASERSADDDAERARMAGDKTLHAAREKHDLENSLSRMTPQARSGIERERAMEDSLRHDRVVVDAELRRQRDANARLLATLLLTEREQTDTCLRVERDRADARLQHRDEFLGMVCHDLRDLLSGIVLSARLIAGQSSAAQASESRRNADRIRSTADRMARLVSDLIDTASIGAGNLRVSRRSEDARRVLAECVETWGAHAAAHGVALEARASDEVHVKIDSERILQVLGNLITNAVRFSPRDSTIEVGFGRTGEDVRFYVKDQGPGIPQDKLELVFERFWQARKDGQHGLGLGLYIARCLVCAHGGRIWAESECGAGSTFCFTVPCA